MGVLASAELLLQAKNYSGSGSWLDEANSHDAQFGSGSGADTNDPLFLDHTGLQYLHLPGASGNYASTPDASALDLTDDFTIIAKMNMDDWDPANEQVIAAKYDYSGSQRSWYLGWDAGDISVRTSNDGFTTTTFFSADAAVPLTDGTDGWIKAEYDKDNGSVTQVEFFTSTDTTNDPTAVSWTKLGNTITAGSVVTTHSGTAPLLIGAVGTSGTHVALLAGRIYRVRILNESSTIVFDADFNTPTEPFATFAESSSNAATVTINRSATGRKAIVVDRDLMLLGANDYFEIPDHADLDVTASDAFTLMVWGRIYDTSPDEDQALVFKKDDLTTSAGYGLYVESGDATAKFLIADGTLDDEDPTANLTVGQAFVVTGVKNETDDDIESFLDGTGGSAVTDSTTSTLANSLTFNIGASSNATPAEFLDGEIFAVAFWNVALSDADVALAGAELQSVGAVYPPFPRRQLTTVRM